MSDPIVTPEPNAKALIDPYNIAWCDEWDKQDPTFSGALRTTPELELSHLAGLRAVYAAGFAAGRAIPEPKHELTEDERNELSLAGNEKIFRLIYNATELDTAATLDLTAKVIVAAGRVLPSVEELAEVIGSANEEWNDLLEVRGSDANSPVEKANLIARAVLVYLTTKGSN